ncbi:MAG: hypothetical protein RL557_87 [archaeon]|jgi:ribosomal RNA assembly protein
MQEIYVDNLAEVLKNKRRIERELRIRLSNRGKNVFIDGNSEDEFLTLEVMKAMNVGFSADTSLLLKEEDVILQIINIKDITKRKDFERIRGRIIGTQGRTLRTLSNLTNCRFAMKDNLVGIIGDSEEIKDAMDGVTLLIQGSKQGNVYGKLERQRKAKRLKGRNLGREFKKEENEEDEEYEDEEDNE